MTPDLLQAAALYVDVARAQEAGIPLSERVLAPKGFRIDISCDPQVNRDRAEAIRVAHSDSVKREK